MEVIILYIVEIIISVVAIFVIYTLNKYITNKDTQKIVQEAIRYAEEAAEKANRENEVHITTGNAKMQIAIGYINKFAPDIIAKYGDNLQSLIEANLRSALSPSK